MTTAEHPEPPLDDGPDLARAADAHLADVEGQLARAERLASEEVADLVMAAREELREGRQAVVGMQEGQR